MKNLALFAFLALAACTATNQPANDGAAPTGTHVQNDTGHPCSPADTRHGICY